MIKTVASLVGEGHHVDLVNYDLLIVIEINKVSIPLSPRNGVDVHADTCQNICGVSVIDNSFEALKRFNLAEIFDPSPRDGSKNVQNTLAKTESASDEASADTKPEASMDLT